MPKVRRLEEVKVGMIGTTESVCCTYLGSELQVSIMSDTDSANACEQVAVWGEMAWSMKATK